MSRVHVVFVMLCSLMLLVPRTVHCEPQVPCYFIFGDSMFDAGNNNYLLSSAKANYLPYGIDFPKGPTGRFTNGKTIGDLITAYLGFTDFIPPYMEATGRTILKGVNYASGAAGILRESGKTEGERFSFQRQVFLHKLTVSRIAILLRSRAAALNHLNKCIYTVGLGSNDYVNNYYMPDAYTTSQEFTTEAYAEVLAQEYKRQLSALYEHGARKVAVLGVGHIGFTPVEISRFGADITTLNAAVDLFNAQLKVLITAFNANLTDAEFTFLNTTGISTGNFTIADLSKTCCSEIEASDYTCVPYERDICADRSQYLFFDNIHPTEVANKAVAARYYSALDPTDAYPSDIKQLASSSSSSLVASV